MSRADATKARILRAATEEFARFGIAGARVDRIAKSAAANKNLIYIYFCSKDQLFDAVFDAHVTQGLGSVPFTPDDLPEYAGRLFDYCTAHPDVVRLSTWYRLERAEQNPGSPARDAELAALAAVRKTNDLGADFSNSALLTLVQSIALAWNPSGVVGISAAETAAETIEDRRGAVVEAVRRLL
ncbi:TetR family transcriptional regulator [Nocardia sp. AG03]|uniref:TetR/AcrR family transcriptional regulator n=1 Tax=Nocardia sp. AG03 TaxID=3025312 RepID=UPI00241864DA|nr:TetR family transcriptional regulator [Nocardia sp. AG03]